jgi:hypothetical protein
LLAAVSAFAIDDDYVRARLERLRAQIQRAAGARATPELTAIDQRFLDLRRDLRPGLSRQDLLALLARISAVESDLARAVGRAGRAGR